MGQPEPVAAFRRDCCVAVAQTVRVGLGLLGVEAPERM
jgi:arginyl-tRNA synthetase